MIFHMICDCFTLLTATLRVSQVAQQSGEEEAESINQVGGEKRGRLVAEIRREIRDVWKPSK